MNENDENAEHKAADSPESAPKEKITDSIKKLSRDEIIQILEHHIQTYEELPDHAKLLPVNHYDLISLMLIVSNILKM